MRHGTKSTAHSARPRSPAPWLQLLADNKNNVVRREAILSRFWNTEDDYFASRSLDVFVNKLRKLLADDPDVSLKTVRGIGLQLIVG